MAIVIKKGESKRSIDLKLGSRPKAKKKGFPAQLFTGKLMFEEDPVVYQRRLRDEGE